jgi:hypothetical protein
MFYDNEDLSMTAQSCKYMKPKSSASSAKMHHDGISCSICNNWDGSRCSRRVFDNMLSGPEID